MNDKTVLPHDRLLTAEEHIYAEKVARDVQSPYRDVRPDIKDLATAYLDMRSREREVAEINRRAEAREQSEDALRVRVDAVLAKDYENGGHEFDCCRRAREYAVDDVKADLASITTVQAEGPRKNKITEDEALKLIQEYNAGYAVVDAMIRAGLDWPDA